MNETESETRNGPEKIARFAWISYQFLAAPLAFSAPTVVFLATSSLWRDEFFVVERPASSQTEWILGFVSLGGFLLLWISGWFVAHRFNHGWRRVMPFGVNLPPLLAMMWMFSRADPVTGEEPVPLFPYLATLVVILGAGMIAACIAIVRTRAS